jgi:hypothetical protein
MSFDSFECAITRWRRPDKITMYCVNGMISVLVEQERQRLRPGA